MVSPIYSDEITATYFFADWSLIPPANNQASKAAAVDADEVPLEDYRFLVQFQIGGLQRMTSAHKG